MTEQPDPAVAQILAERVAMGDGSKPFGEFTPADATAQGERLAEVAGFGTEQRVQPVANAWRTLAKVMDREAAATVADLDPETVAKQAERVWVVPPGGSLL